MCTCTCIKTFFVGLTWLCMLGNDKKWHDYLMENPCPDSASQQILDCDSDKQLCTGWQSVWRNDILYDWAFTIGNLRCRK